MLSYGDSRDNASLYQTNEVIFRNVRSRYKFENKISVLYVLSPKTKTSTHDYVGIYPRGWTHLREFVGFEHPIPAPFEEPSLDRCIQFNCSPQHVSAVVCQDYQFVYVNQYHEVLGKSDFFQFVEEDHAVLSGSAAAFQETNDCGDNDPDWPSDNITSFENLGQYVSDAEYAYNSCYFGDNRGNTHQESISQSGKNFAGQEDASNACFVPSTQNKLEASTAHFIPEETCYQNSDQELYFKPRRGRPLIKTREGGYLDYQTVSTEPPSPIQRKYSTFRNNRSMDAPKEMPYSQKWLPPTTWHFQSNRTSNQVVQFSGRSDVNRGAIPKQCPKCHVPSDYVYKQQLMRHNLEQAHEQIRDLNNRVDQLQQELQLSYAAQAKLKVVAEIAKTESKNAVSFLNSLMLSLVTQYKTKIVNFDNTVMYVTRELESPGWLSREGPTKTLLCGRPTNVRVVSGREKELKAIIGRQEMMIQKLHNDLKLAAKIIDCANLASSNLNLELLGRKRGRGISSAGHTHGADGDGSKILCNYNNEEGSRFNLTAINEVIHSIGDDVTNEHSVIMSEEKAENRSARLQLDDGPSVPTSDSSEVSQDLSGTGTIVVQPDYYNLDPLQSWNREVIVDDNVGSVCSENDADAALTSNETNNNDYDTKNLNSDEERKSDCDVCEPTLGSTHRKPSMETSN